MQARAEPMNTITLLAKKWRLAHPTAFDHHLTAIRTASIVILALIGWLDYITGYEFGFFIFYFIPVSISAWYCGRRPGVAIACVSAVCWFLSDMYTKHPYSRAYFIYWEMFMRLVSFLTTALTLARIREFVLGEERLIRELLSVQAENERLQEMLRSRQ